MIDTGYNIRAGSIELAHRRLDYEVVAGNDVALAVDFDSALVAARTLVLEDGHELADTYLGDRIVASTTLAEYGAGVVHRYADVDRPRR